MRLATCSRFPHSLGVVEVLADVWDAVLMGFASETLCIDSSIVGLTCCVIALLTAGIVGFGIGILTDIFMIVAVVVLLFDWKTCSCCTTAAWNCRSLQARMPSCHVWPRFEFPALPHFPTQEPPRPQQLSLPDFFMVPHSGHTELANVVVTTDVGI